MFKGATENLQRCEYSYRIEHLEFVLTSACEANDRTGSLVTSDGLVRRHCPDWRRALMLIMLGDDVEGR